MSLRKQTCSKSEPLLSVTSTVSINESEAAHTTDTRVTKRLFPLLDTLLRFMPMFVTQKRCHPFVNIIGVSLTFIGVIALCIWRYTGNTYIKNNLNSMTNYWILETVTAIVEPIQVFSQIMFYAKYFRYKFTFDPRDNYIIKFIKLKRDKNKFEEITNTNGDDNDVEIVTCSCFGRYRKDVSFTDFVSLRLIRSVIWGSVIIVWVAFFIGSYFHWKDADQNERFINNMPQSLISTILMYGLYLIPTTLHSIILFLYLIDWKLRIRYLWKYSFKHKIESNDLVDYYDNFRLRFMEQIFWIKVWMIANLCFGIVGFWIWLKLIVDSWGNDEFFPIVAGQGIGFLTFNSGIPTLIWLLAASITLESTFVYTKTVQYLKEYHSKLENNEAIHHIDDYRKHVTLNLNRVVHDDVNENIDSIDIDHQIQQIQKIQQIQTFLLYYSDNGCSFSIFGIDVSYNALLTLVVGFISSKIIDWAATAADV